MRSSRRGPLNHWSNKRSAGLPWESLLCGSWQPVQQLQFLAALAVFVFPCFLCLPCSRPFHLLAHLRFSHVCTYATYASRVHAYSLGLACAIDIRMPTTHLICQVFMIASLPQAPSKSMQICHRCSYGINALTPSMHSCHLCTHAIRALMRDISCTHAIQALIPAVHSCHLCIHALRHACAYDNDTCVSHLCRIRVPCAICRAAAVHLGSNPSMAEKSFGDRLQEASALAAYASPFILCISSRSLQSLHLVHPLCLATSNVAFTRIPCNRCTWCIPVPCNPTLHLPVLPASRDHCHPTLLATSLPIYATCPGRSPMSSLNSAGGIMVSVTTLRLRRPCIL